MYLNLSALRHWGFKRSPFSCNNPELDCHNGCHELLNQGRRVNDFPPILRPVLAQQYLRTEIAKVSEHLVV